MKTIKVSEILSDLKSGVHRYKKDDVGFGSLEEKYDLTFTELKQIINHPKIKGIKTQIPSLQIIDDTENIIEGENEDQPATIEVAQLRSEEPLLDGDTYIQAEYFQQEESMQAFI